MKKRLTITLIASAILASILGGCIIVPGGGWHDGYYRDGYYGR